MSNTVETKYLSQTVAVTDGEHAMKVLDKDTGETVFSVNFHGTPTEDEISELVNKMVAADELPAVFTEALIKQIKSKVVFTMPAGATVL